MQTSRLEELRKKIARARDRRGERGVALVMVLGALAILAVMLTEFQDETSADFGHALSERDAIRAEYAAKSAVNLTRLLIASEPTMRKDAAIMLRLLTGGVPQLPVWEHAESILGAFNGKDGQAAFRGVTNADVSEGENLGLDGASFQLTVVDEDSKINFNSGASNAIAAQRFANQLMGLIGSEQYNPLFDERDSDGSFSTRQNICAAIVDWSDVDQDTFACDFSGQNIQTGSEDSFYQLLPDAYERKNAPFDSLEELHMVRGVTDDFWSTFVEPNGDDPSSRAVTVWGSNKVNVNSAPAQVLLALIAENAVDGSPIKTEVEIQERFLMTVGLFRSLAKGVPAFSSPKRLIQIMQGRGTFGPMVLNLLGIEPIQFKSETELAGALKTESSVFSIYATGVVDSGRRRTLRRIHAVVDFAGAPRPPDPFANITEEQQGDLAALRAETVPQPDDTPENFDFEGGVSAFFAPSPSGKVVYYRVY